MNFIPLQAENNPFAGVIIAMLLAIIALFLLMKILKLRKRVVVRDHEAGLLWEKGKYRGLVKPGAYKFWFDEKEIRVVGEKTLDEILEQRSALSDPAMKGSTFVLGDALKVKSTPVIGEVSEDCD